MEIEIMRNHIIREIDVIKEDDDLREEIIFFLDNENVYSMFHYQDCCENVLIEDICGDLQDLIVTPLLDVYEESNRNEEGDFETFTWTFYHFRTIKGSVAIRWYGTSNGYYSESVDFDDADGNMRYYE